MKVTKTGVAVLVVAIGFLSAGFSAAYPQLILLGSAASIALITAFVWVKAIPPDVAISDRQVHPHRPVEGSVARIVVTVSNKRRSRTAPLTLVERVGDLTIPISIPSLAGLEARQINYEVRIGRRGKYRVVPPALGHSDPFRLLTIERTGTASGHLYIHPRIDPAVRPISTGGVRDAEGPTSASAPQGGIAFHSLRDYQPGDDWRLIHWGASARIGRPTVRHQVIPDEPRHIVVLDTSAAPYPNESFNDAVRVAASLCHAAVAAGFSLEVWTTGGRCVTVDATSGAQVHSVAALDLLAEVETSAGDDGIGWIATRPWVGEALSLAVVSGDADSRDIARLSAIRRQFLTMSVVSVGAGVSRVGPSFRGVATLLVRNSEDFAPRWNKLVLG